MTEELPALVRERDYGSWGEPLRKARPPYVRWLLVVAFALLVASPFLLILRGVIWKPAEKVPTSRTADIGVTTAGAVPLRTLRVGDCLLEQPGAPLRAGVRVGVCDVAHFQQVVAVVALGDTWPGADPDERVEAGCAKALVPYGRAGYGTAFHAPSRDAWDRGLHQGLCLVTHPGDDYLRGSAIGPDGPVSP